MTCVLWNELCRERFKDGRRIPAAGGRGVSKQLERAGLAGDTDGMTLEAGLRVLHQLLEGLRQGMLLIRPAQSPRMRRAEQRFVAAPILDGPRGGTPKTLQQPPQAMAMRFNVARVFTAASNRRRACPVGD